MSQDYEKANPYSAPLGGYTAEQGPRPGDRTNGTTTLICILAIVLGGLGIVGALGSFVGFAMQGFMQGAVFNNPELADDPGMQMQKEIYAVSAKYNIALIPLAIVHLVVASLLVAGGILAMRGSTFGFLFLARTMIGTIVFEIVRMIVMVVSQIEISRAMSGSMQKMIEAEAQKGGGNGPPPEMFGTIMAASMGVGICFVVGWVLVKVGFYGFGSLHLLRRSKESVVAA